LNAINRKGQIEPETDSHQGSSSASITDRNKEKTKPQYANLAQRGLQFLTNGLDSSSINGFDSGVALEMASQFMRQNAKLSKNGFDPQMAKSALNLLMSAVGNQKLDPKMVFGLVSKLMQSQQSGQHDGDMGMNLLSQMLSSGQLTSMLLNGARGMQSADSGDTSKSIYRNYMKHASKFALMLKSKSNRIRSGSQRKLGVDLNFKYDAGNIDACKSKGENSTLYLVMVISSANRQMERQAARDTWINDFHNLNKKVKMVFFIGQSQSNNFTLQKSIREESEKYRDIVQIGLDHSGDIEGKVSLMTTLGGLNWINKNCIGIYR